MKRILATLTLAATVLAAPQAMAFCGFYLGGAGADLYANATQVVLMREGTTTVLSMQNQYDGPAEDFAMVVPVPVVLMQDDVKTLEPGVFAKIDTLSAPRLVEYFQADPCAPQYDDRDFNGINNAVPEAGGNNGVVVEAQFKVGEYDISILSANDSSGLETWLTDNNYNIPMGAAPYFEPYVQSGMYFFVAKVDIALAPKVNGKTVLSPLRFAYTSQDFALPVRLGMINSQGTQDLIVYTLGRNQRYEVANRPNVTIPTNIEVVSDVRDSFSNFYQTLFSQTLKANPEAVVTEYAWQASNCDPCPGPVLDAADLLTFGADQFTDLENDQSWVVTRLHARYDKDDIAEDLVFKAVNPIVGGREFVVDPDTGKLEEGAQESDINNFQGRYIIRNPWTGAVDCAEPNTSWSSQTKADKSPNTKGTDVVLDADRNLVPDIIGSVPELDITGTGERTVGTMGNTNGTVDDPGTGLTSQPGKLDGGGCSATGLGAMPFAFGLLMLGWRRRK
ncbi:MAG: DUF2330 domain-containing protein [bacterium]